MPEDGQQAQTDADGRDFEIVLWGATGFTGRLVAEYLAGGDGAGDIPWAIAGRNRQKLEALRDDLQRDYPELGDLPILEGDALDRESLDRIAARTRVVCTTVGPYAKYGSDLVAACVEHGTDYCDLTGEVHWAREMIDRHHERAVETGARIVHFCGFDSIPSDLGTLMVQEHARQTHGGPCEEVKFFVEAASGGFSGGTIASMIGALEAASGDPEIRRVMGHPYALNPDGEQSGPDGSTQQGVRYDEDLEAWTGPFVMAQINEKVVRRSNALLDYPYGPSFRYGESAKTGAGLKGAAVAGGLSAGMGAFAGALALKPTRKLLQKVALPAPGEGPSREEIENGYFRIKLIGRGVGEDGAAFRVAGRVGADRDPGYGATAMMLGETALGLALDEPDPDKTLSGGVLTPSTALGMTLVERLREAGMTWECEDE